MKQKNSVYRQLRAGTGELQKRGSDEVVAPIRYQ